MNLTSRQIQAEKTKAKILKAGLALIAQDGQQGLSASRLASRAGVSKGTIFHHFESMDDLLFSMMVFFFQTFTQELSEECCKTPEEFLLSLGNKALDESMQSKELVTCFLSFYEKSLFDDRYKNLFKEQFEFVFTFIAQSLQSYYKQSIPKKQLELTSMMITFVCDSMGIYFQIFEDPKLFKEYWALYSKMVTSYLEKYKRKGFR